MAENHRTLAYYIEGDDVNGHQYQVDAPNDKPLLWVLRDDLKFGRRSDWFAMVG